MKKFKVLLLAIYSGNMYEGYEEIGMCSIASYLRENGNEVVMIGKREEKLDFDAIASINPDIVGMSVYSESKKAVHTATEELKKRLPDVSVCLGGYLPTYYAEELMNEMQVVDFLIRGEGEAVFKDLVSCLESGSDYTHVGGLVYREGERIIIGAEQEVLEDLDKLPYPARDYLIENKLETAIVFTSRGCMARCTFCNSHKFWKKWRGRSVKSSVDELEHIIKNYGVTAFNIIDASFEDPGSDSGRAWGIAEEIVKRNLNITFFADFRAEFHRNATPQMMELLYKAGLCGVCIGIETGNTFDQKLFNKIATPEDNAKCIELFEKYDITVNAGFINFNPYSSFEGLRENIAFLERFNRTNFSNIASSYRLYQHSDLFYTLEADGLVTQGEYDDPRRYTFKDPRLQALMFYLNNYLDGLDNSYGGIVSSYNFYSNFYFIELTYYKRFFERAGSKECLDTVLQAEEKIKELYSPFNQRISDWFKELLALAETGWDHDKADSISNGMLGVDMLQGVVKALKQSSDDLMMTLKQINGDDTSYLKNIFG